VVADALSTYVIGINNISTSCSANNYNPPRLYMAKNMIADVAAESSSGAGSTSISNGVVKINANVNASFYVK
jgi:predicted secreted protein